jgi:hypothetical protein
MSSVGFNPALLSPEKELEKLRESWHSLNDLSKDLTNAGSLTEES